MGSGRYPSHQLPNGLYVSGHPDQPKERPITMNISGAIPYTGGDVKKSGELGKMFDIHVKDGSKPRNKSGPVANAYTSRTESFRRARVASHSGPLPGRVLPVTGLITSGPISSGPLNSFGAPRKFSPTPFDTTGSFKLHSGAFDVHNQAITNLRHQEDDYFFSNRNSIPKPIMWVVILLFVMGIVAGGFIFYAVHNAILLIVVVILFIVVAALFTWYTCSGTRSITGFIDQYPDTDLRTAKDGQYVKVSGKVNCGNFTLESSFQMVPRCVYSCTSLYEYRGWDSKPANDAHRHFTWGLRYLENQVVDFYISDFQSGLRALVKTGYGARVTPYVDESSVVVDVNPTNKDIMSPRFVEWLGRKNLSSDDRIMQLREGYIKEGTTVGVMGVLRRNNNVLMIEPPAEPLSTGCKRRKCILPASLEGIVLRCEDSSKVISL